jgi:hypothetical protein
MKESYLKQTLEPARDKKRESSYLEKRKM